MDNLPMRPEVFVTYFVHDERKGGGDYVTGTGTVKKVDEFQRLLILTDGTKIPLDEIYDISGELFHNFEKSNCNKKRSRCRMEILQRLLFLR